LSNSRHFQLIPISQLIARRAADLRARYNLRTPDALQLASTIQQRCDAFLTNDAGLKRVQEIRVLLIEELELSDLST
jgi:predicted nucleic acid-binding protein